MCIPVAAALAVVSTAVSVMGGIQQSNAEAKAADYNAAVARNNQIIAQQNASAALEQGNAAVDAQRRKTAALLGSQRSTLAANGVDLGSGSALDVQSDTAILGQLDAATIGYNAQVKANDYLNQAGGYGAEASFDRSKAAAAVASGQIGAAQGLLSGASQVASAWTPKKGS